MIATDHRPTYRRFTRGKRSDGTNFNAYGWVVKCSCGAWERRHLGPKSEATRHFQDHLRDVHRAMVGLTLNGLTI